MHIEGYPRTWTRGEGCVLEYATRTPTPGERQHGCVALRNILDLSESPSYTHLLAIVRTK